LGGIHSAGGEDYQMTMCRITDKRFEVDYSITAGVNISIEAYAREICLEQTVEVPENCLTQEHFDYEIPGKIERITVHETGQNNYIVTISYPCDITAYSVPQFLNTLFGNISLKNNIRIMAVRLPDEMKNVFPGPRYGVEGLRRYLGVFGRPLTCTALKPVGLTSKEIAAMASQFTSGGADIIKDDHGMTDQPYARFEERVTLVQDAVNEVNVRTGRKTLYCPMLNDEPDALQQQIIACKKAGVEGALVAPMLIGCGTVAMIRKSTDMILMTHPAFAGTFLHSNVHGATHGFLLGTLFRLIGADISIFPNAGGRFFFSQEECDSICDNLRMESGHCKPSFPAPAGGMRIERIEEMVSRYGDDTVFIIGGNLLQQGNKLAEATKLFLDTVRSCSNERLVS
jgi:ribulose-bisphosphate carboxylase large chain